jgi:hypothetical protein
MDEDTKAAFRGVICAIETLTGAVWQISDVREKEGTPSPYIGVVAPNPAHQIEALLAAAKALTKGE